LVGKKAAKGVIQEVRDEERRVLRASSRVAVRAAGSDAPCSEAGIGVPMRT
jgi:hypothetical protein